MNGQGVVDSRQRVTRLMEKYATDIKQYSCEKL